jgi:hypothetical protein
MKELPNILLCTCDQLRSFEVGCYGNPVIRTPNVDRLAQGGVRFGTAVTNFPVCMAARSVLFSGQANRTCTGGLGNVAFPGGPAGFFMCEYPEAGRPHPGPLWHGKNPIHCLPARAAHPRNPCPQPSAGAGHQRPPLVLERTLPEAQTRSPAPLSQTRVAVGVIARQQPATRRGGL